MKLALPRISKSDVLEYDGEHLRFEREWEDGTLLMTRLASDRPFLIDGEVPTAKWLLQEFGKRLTIVPDRVPTSTGDSAAACDVAISARG